MLKKRFRSYGAHVDPSRIPVQTATKTKAIGRVTKVDIFLKWFDEELHKEDSEPFRLAEFKNKYGYTSKDMDRIKCSPKVRPQLKAHKIKGENKYSRLTQDR